MFDLKKDKTELNFDNYFFQWNFEQHSKYYFWLCDCFGSDFERERELLHA